MLPFINLYMNFLMDVIVDESSDEDVDELSFSLSDEMSDMSDESTENLDDPDYDPDYEPLLVHMDDQPYEYRQSSQESADSSAASDLDVEEPNDANVEPDAEQNVNNANEEIDDANEEIDDANEEIEDVNEETHDVPAKPAENLDKPIASSQRGSDDDGQICTICFEPWTSSNDHRLVSLRCGHLFGRSCITRWLKGQNARCPQCNARARKSEIRNIYAKAVKAIDCSERDKALQDLMRETELRRAAEIAVAQERIKHMLVVQEFERVKKELMETQKQLLELRSGSRTFNNTQSAKALSSAFHLEQSIDLTKDGGCRIVDSCDVLGMLLVSQPSCNPLFPGYGFRKISTLDMKPSEFVLVHQKPIRDMAFHAHDGLVLTASLDKTLKITNILTNSTVQTYNLGSDVWSCTWDADNSVYFYGGLKTGEVYVFDIRATNRHVHELPRYGAKTPVVSLQYLRKLLPTSSSKCGPIVGKLSDCALHQKTHTEGQYNIIPMPALGPFTCLSSEPSGHFLVSCRPSPKQPRVTHTVCDFMTTTSGDLICCPVKTVTGGRTQLQLTRSKLLSHPEKESSLLICAGDEDARGALIWDGSSGECIENLRTDSPVLDLAGFKVNHSTFLTALTDKSLRIYSWNHR